MSRRARLTTTLSALLLLLAITACPPPAKRGRSVKADKPAAKAGLFSVTGMTGAILEMDESRGSAAMKPIQERLEKDYKVQPKNPFKRFLWAYSLDDRNKGWQELVNVTKLNSKFYWAYVGMGVILDEWKVYDQSQSNFEHALKLGPKIALGYGRYGRMRLHKGDFGKAVELLSQAVQMAPRVPGFQMDLARAYAAQGQAAKAIEAYSVVTASKPDMFAAHSELAQEQRKAGDKEGAVKSYGQAAKLSPKAYPVRFARAQVLQELGRDDEAVSAYQDACKVRPNTLVCWQALAALGAKLKRQPLRVSASEEVIRIQFENKEAHQYLAPIYLAEGFIEKALPSYQFLLIKNPKDVDSMAGLAVIYEKGEEFSKAIDFVLRVLEHKADHAAAMAARDRLFGRFHILPEAIEGNSPDKVFSANRKQIAAVYKKMVEKKPNLKGDLSIKVSVDNDGVVQNVSMAKDSVGDQVLDICAVWNLRRSKFPSGFGATYDFELTLKPGDR